MPKKVFIFDFDGTIADSFLEVVKALNMLAKRFDYNEVEPARWESLKSLSSRDFYIKTFGISPLKLIWVAKAVEKQLGRQIDQIRPVAGMPEVLGSIKEEGVRMGIVTSNSIRNVRRFLQKNDLDFFDFILTGNIFFKHWHISQCVRQNRLDKEHTYYIGDETRDIQAARKSGVKAVSVTWGFATGELLERYEPDAIVSRPNELEKLE